MMHSFDGLADEISTLLKNRGYTGYRSYGLENLSDISSLTVTPRCAPVLPVAIEGLRPAQSRGNSKSESNQSLARGVTPVTPITRDFEEAKIANVDDDDFPSE
jgi:hypothetical protein